MQMSTADFLTLYMVKWSWVLLKMNNSTPVIYNDISYILSYYNRIITMTHSGVRIKGKCPVPCNRTTV